MKTSKLVAVLIASFFGGRVLAGAEAPSDSLAASSLTQWANELGVTSDRQAQALPAVQARLVSTVDASQGRPLTSGEIEMARTVFGDSIDYSKVKVYSRKS